MIIRNGFIRGNFGSWINLNEIRVFYVRFNDVNTWSIVALLINPDFDEPGEENGLLNLGNFDTCEEAESALDMAFGVDVDKDI